MSFQEAIQNKNHAIPGYKGYVPGAKPDNALGETFTTISRRCFTRERLDTKPN